MNLVVGSPTLWCLSSSCIVSGAEEDALQEREEKALPVNVQNPGGPGTS